MRILSVGGGSGGHVTPIAAVCDNIHQRSPEAELRVWCDRKFADRLRGMVDTSVRVDVVVSGKLRRYANLTIWKHLRYHIFRTHFMNFVDLFKIAFGFFQSILKLVWWRPDVVFCKGGFVCLPVGLAARVLRIPLVIHDSDTVAGLTNRILSRFASKIGTGSPVENYPNYQKSKMKYVGVPVREDIVKLNLSDKKTAKFELGFEPDKDLIFAVGGGGGATRLNRAVFEMAPTVIKMNCQILLLSGGGKSGMINIPEDLRDNFKVVEFMSDDMAKAIGAADIVVTRAGATAIAEFAAVSAATIIVPSPHLAGDHQTKNAKVYEKSNAAIVIDEREMAAKPDIILEAVVKLIEDRNLRKELGDNLSKFAKPTALDDMVDMILGTCK